MNSSDEIAITSYVEFRQLRLDLLYFFILLSRHDHIFNPHLQSPNQTSGMWGGRFSEATDAFKNLQHSAI